MECEKVVIAACCKYLFVYTSIRYFNMLLKFKLAIH